MPIGTLSDIGMGRQHGRLEVGIMARAAWLVWAERQHSSFLRDGLFHAGPSARKFKRNKVGHCASRPANNAGQLIRLCLYKSNVNGMPAILLKDGGETAMVVASGAGSDVVNFASVTTDSNAIFWVDAQLKQPSSAQFEAEEFPQNLPSNSALSELTIGTTNGSTYSSPTPYGPCPAVGPGLSTIVSDPKGFKGNTVTLAVGIGH